MHFQLYLPEAWVADAARRRKTGIPDDLTFRRQWEIALGLLDQAREWGLPVAIVTADAGYGVATEFRPGLASRQYLYVLGITKDTTV